MLLTAGERISMAAARDGDRTTSACEARSFTGTQAGVITDATPRARAHHRRHPGPHPRRPRPGHVAIVAGFQGVSQDSKDITTLGRGGSDTTAVALAAALDADVCEIYTDVDGVFTADPRIVPTARRLDRVTYEEMLEMAACGAKVLNLRCVEYARRYALPIHVRSSFSDRTGTWVVADPTTEGEDDVEQPIISGVAHDRSEAKVTVVGVPDQPGEAAAIFEAVADADVNIDMIVQNVSAAATAPHRHHVHAAQVRGRPGHRHAGRAQGRHRLRVPRSTTTRSARCRWSVPACARTPASPPRSSVRWPTPASTSS